MLNQRACLCLCLFLFSAAAGRGAEAQKTGTGKIPANILKKIKEARAKAAAAKTGSNAGKPERKPAPEKTVSKTDAVKKSGVNVVDDYAALTASFQNVEVQQKEIFYYQCRNVRSSTLKRVLDNFITSSGTVAASEESDLVVVQDVKPNIPRLKEISEKVDQRVPQILVEAQIVELTLDDDFEKELNYNFQHVDGDLAFVKELLVNITTPGAQPQTGQGFSGTFRPYVKNYSGNKQNILTSFLRYLETKGKARILSAPNLILRRGSEGSIVTGQDVPIQEKTVTSGGTNISTSFKRVGITLKVKPIMIRNGTVRMSVNPGASTVTGFSGDNPIIALRNATTELEIKDKELISIGGLLRNEKRTVSKRVPVVSSIPLLGHFFRSTRIETVRTQLVIFITVTILDEGTPGGMVLHKPRDIPAGVRQEIKEMDAAERRGRPRAQILQDLNHFIHGGGE